MSWLNFYCFFNAYQDFFAVLAQSPEDLSRCLLEALVKRSVEFVDLFLEWGASPALVCTLSCTRLPFCSCCECSRCPTSRSSQERFLGEAIAKVSNQTKVSWLIVGSLVQVMFITIDFQPRSTSEKCLAMRVLTEQPLSIFLRHDSFQCLIFLWFSYIGRRF